MVADYFRFSEIVSIHPILMSDWQMIENVALKLPVGHELVHQSHKAAVVRRLEQMHHFMHYDIFQAFRWLFSQFRIEPNASGNRVATPPSRFHPLDKNPRHLHAQQWLPFCDKRRQSQPELFSVPSGNHRLALFQLGSGADHQNHLPMF